MDITFGKDKNIKNPYSEQIVQQLVYRNFSNPVLGRENSDVFVKNADSLAHALKCLENLTFDRDDLMKVKRFGAVVVFKNGQEALQFAKDRNIEIVYEKVSNPDVHAQWDDFGNKIIINERYRNTKNLAEIYAISAAILHELSHAKDEDAGSSIQEEIDCLAMNSLAFNVFRRRNPELFKGQNSPIIEDGVELYANLFFGNDEEALVRRIKLKYGNLMISSKNHPASKFVIKHFGFDS